MSPPRRSRGMAGDLARRASEFTKTTDSVLGVSASTRPRSSESGALTGCSGSSVVPCSSRSSLTCPATVQTAIGSGVGTRSNTDAMARRMTPAQYRSAVNKAQREQKQAVDKYNRAARQHNAAVKKVVGDYNRDVRTYNSKARARNTRVENQRRRLNQEIRRLNSRPAATTFVTYRSSVETLARMYKETEESLADRTLTHAGRELLDRGSEEAANSAYLLNAMGSAARIGDN